MAWREEAGGFAPELFVWVDECGTHTSMTRTRARAPKGERAYAKVPRNRGKNTTLIASMPLSGMGASMAIEGCTDKEVFEAYVEHFLAPSLWAGQVVVMDRLQRSSQVLTIDVVAAVLKPTLCVLGRDRRERLGHRLDQSLARARSYLA